MRIFVPPLLIITLFFDSSAAGEIDKQASLGITVNQDLPKGFDIDFLHELRSKEDNSTLKKSLSEVGLRYKINKYISTRVGYRYSVYRDKFSERQILSGTFKIETGVIRHRYRLMYQHDVDSDDDPDETIRHRYGVRYKWKWGVSPFMDLEAFTTRSSGKTEIVKHRENIGLKKKLNKDTSIKLYYRLQEEMNVKNPVSIRMIGILFDIELG